VTRQGGCRMGRGSARHRSRRAGRARGGGAKNCEQKGLKPSKRPRSGFIPEPPRRRPPYPIRQRIRPIGVRPFPDAGSPCPPL